MISTEFIGKYKETISDEGQQLVLEFFVTFSRVECALKSSIKFAQISRKKVEPNWDKFISSISERFDKTANEKLKSAVDFLLQEPPKVQTIREDNLVWIDREFSQGVPELHKISFHIRDIRNNLFHGGKFNGNYQPDISRNYRLIKSALIIINQLIILDNDIRENFIKDIVL